MKITLLLGMFLVVFSGTAHADEEVSESVPMTHKPTKDIEFNIGIAGGGSIGLLAPIKGLKETTTEPFTGTLHSRLRFPKISSRILELYAVYPSGVGINLKNDDFRLGRFRFSVVDVGLFWNTHKPVAVQRVRRKMDVTIGTSFEYRVSKSWAMTADYRIFLPANVFKILTDYGDFARLIGHEAAQGGQLWGGFSYCW